MQRSQPETYRPPYPAYQAHPPPDRPDYVAGLIIVQARNGADASALLAQVRAMLSFQDAGRPEHFEQADYVDATGAACAILLPYWKTVDDQRAFLERGDFLKLVATPLAGDVGMGVECFNAPTMRLDGNYAIRNVEYGIGRYSEVKEEQYHAYMGSMRDRVPGFLSGESDAGPAPLRQHGEDVQTLGRALTITDLPDNLCYIRSGFAWKNATQEEQTVYMRDMMPVYREGAEYLRDNPEESNCISMRMAETVELDFDSGVQSNAIGWFLTLKDLERWVRTHPRHLAIMRTIMDYMQRFDFKPKLNLGHEVVVIPGGRISAWYNNCHGSTGFLRFFKAIDVECVE